jgi:type I restriction-modification system DNA methylase subunit
MAAPETIVELIERFDRNHAAYKSDQYNEARLRIEFLNPFFEALGWDINNRQGYAEAYKDVIYEDAIKIGGATKAPDYCFRIGGTRKFFVEAKKPAVNLKDASDPAFQLRRYAWSAKLPLSILTDFEEFAMYDCRVKPDRDDKAATARIVYMPYTDYVQRWDEIASIFSREAILKGSFDTYAEATKGKRGTTEVDAAFLQEIESWREMLARHLALRNKILSQRELNFAVQMTIDRIIFLRICEDRGIEEYERLKTLLKGPNVYARLCTFFQEADVRYNSGLFHFQKEKDNPEAPDTLTLSLLIDDKPLKDIFKRLYYPESPYEFSALPADVLGKVYEQFLGKVIRLSPSHQVTVEEKPEVRKAGGVYYTPNFIVEYIVQHTLSKLLEGKKPGIRGTASKLKIVDPSCGSGSFLIVAYQYLLDWHRDRYVEDGPEKHRKELYQGPGGQWLLTTQEKKRILLNNIYGVDIDPQAVEVTKLSLLLKVLEGESNQSLVAQLSLFKERALPDLDHNIKCGNSLIDSKFYDKIQQQTLFDEDTQYRINAFDWASAFPEAFSGEDPGFDAVIGNPPYIRIQALKEWTPLEVEYYKHAYQAASKGNYDIYVVFVERGLSLLNKHGQLGYILPHKFFNAQYGEPLRALLAENKSLSEIVHFGDKQIFEQATTYTCLLFLDKAGSKECRVIKVDDLLAWRNTGKAQEGKIPSERITQDEWNFNVGQGGSLFDRLSQMPTKLRGVAHLFVGLQTDADDVYILEEIRQEDGRVLCKSKSTGSQHWFEDSHLKPFLKGSLNIRRYYLTNVTKRLIFPYELKQDKSELIDATEYKRCYPLTWSYLEENRKLLSARNKGKMGQEWYGYVYRKNHTRFNSPKLLVPSIATGSSFAADLHGTYYFVGSGGGGGGGYGITLLEEAHISYSYLLGLLNSSLLSAYLKTVSTPFRGGYIALNRQYIEQLPIRNINFSDPDDKALHDRMVELVERMLSLHKRLSEARIPQDKTMLQQQIDVTDRQIDGLVYELYGLTEEEIGIVEG